MLRSIATGLLLGTLMASSSLAADLSVPAAPSVTPPAPVSYSTPGHDWSGFYAGVIAGSGFGDTTFSGGQSATVSGNGLLGGVTAGANMQYDQFVYGVEGDLAWDELAGSATCGTTSCNTDHDWNGTLRARVGYAIDPVLVYATGGLAAAGINTGVSTAVAGTTGTYSDTYYGLTVGAGVEAAITEQLSAKAEYAYTDFGDRVAPAGTLAATNTTVSPSNHAIKVGLNFHF